MSPDTPTDEEESFDADGVDGSGELNESVEPGEFDEPETVDESQPKWPTDHKSRMRRVEAVLFMSRSPLPSRKLSQLAELEDGTQARTMVKQLNEHYDRVGRAFHIKKVSGGFQLRTRPQFADWISRLDYIPTPTRLSNPALETLTVVAYRQPIIKAEIEAIRGVSCGEMLRQLLEKGLVKIAGRSEKLGRPYLYATAKEFLTQFGLGSLKELPRGELLSGEGLPEWADSNNNLPDSVNDTKVLDPDLPLSQIDHSQNADSDSDDSQNESSEIRPLETHLKDADSTQSAQEE